MIMSSAQALTHHNLSGEHATTHLKGTIKLVQTRFQEEFAALHAKYMEVKAQRIQDVEEAITEIRAQEQVRSKKAMQVDLFTCSILGSAWEEM